MNVKDIVGKKVIGVTTAFRSDKICGLELQFEDKTRLTISEKYIDGWGWVEFYIEYNEKV